MLDQCSRCVPDEMGAPGRMKLKPNQRCPIHGRRDCCGREGVPERAPAKRPLYRTIGVGIHLYPDGHVERSKGALVAHKNYLLRTGHTCAACGQPFDDYCDAELSHRVSKGMGG